MVPTKGVIGLEDYSYASWQWWGVWITPSNVREESGKVQYEARVCSRVERSQGNVLWPGGNIGGHSLRTQSGTHSSTLTPLIGNKVAGVKGFLNTIVLNSE